MSHLDHLGTAADVGRERRGGGRKPAVAADAGPVYMVFDRGKEWGPFSRAEVWLYAGEGRFNAAAQARHLGHPGWFNLAALLAGAEAGNEPEPARVRPAVPAPVPPVAPVASIPAAPAHQRDSQPEQYRPGMHTNRVAAGVFALLLPAGIHKFLMGFIGAGVLQLLLTVATCGVASVTGVVEGIIYLTKSEEQFFYDYHVGRRTWF